MTNQEAANIIGAWVATNPDSLPLLEDAYRRGWHPVQIARLIQKSLADAWADFIMNEPSSPAASHLFD